MNLTVYRNTFTPISTIGQIVIDDEQQPFCYTLEDPVREVRGPAIKQWKIPGKTAIPYGSYPVIISHSPKFKREMPLMMNVPGFLGARIHVGNWARNTDGCLLVGKTVGDDYIGQSRVAYNELFARMKHAQAAGEDISILFTYIPQALRSRV